MTLKTYALLVVCLSLFAACTATEQKQDKPSVVANATEEKTAPPLAETATAPAMPPSTAPDARPAGTDSQSIRKRVNEAQTRLGLTKAGQLIWRSIEHHGGLQSWHEQRVAGFRFEYKPLHKPGVRDTYQFIDLWSSRARHEVRTQEGVEFGWDGKNAWISPAGTEPPTNVRFWALTPYYFVAMPFVLSDPGVNLAVEEPQTLEGKPCDVVRATFQADVGDAPDDYYVVYLEKGTGRVAGLRYVVSYKGFFKDGGHSPEKLMIYEGSTTGDIKVATSYPTYEWSDGAKGRKVTDIQLTEFGAFPDMPASRFEVPAQAEVLEGF